MHKQYSPTITLFMYEAPIKIIQKIKESTNSRSFMSPLQKTFVGIFYFGTFMSDLG